MTRDTVVLVITYSGPIRFVKFAMVTENDMEASILKHSYFLTKVA
jgi:hypothetical protein